MIDLEKDLAEDSEVAGHLKLTSYIKNRKLKSLSFYFHIFFYRVVDFNKKCIALEKCKEEEK